MREVLRKERHELGICRIAREPRGEFIGKKSELMESGKLKDLGLRVGYKFIVNDRDSD